MSKQDATVWWCDYQKAQEEKDYVEQSYQEEQERSNEDFYLTPEKELRF